MPERFSGWPQARFERIPEDQLEIIRVNPNVHVAPERWREFMVFVEPRGKKHPGGFELTIHPHHHRSVAFPSEPFAHTVRRNTGKDFE